jgi:thiol-disulfide isomerase/thioredoxin
VKLKAYILLLFLAILLAKSTLSATNQRATMLTPAIPFVLPDIKGNSRNSSEWKNKVIVLNFWATWCPSCIKEIPEFIHLQRKLGGKGVQFIGIALDTLDEVKNFSLVYNINYPILIGELEGADLTFRYGNSMGVLPFSVIIDRNGRVISRHKGVLEPKELEIIITPLL